MRIANRAGAVLMAAALFTLVFVVLVFIRDARRYDELNEATNRVHLITDTAQTALSALKDAETGQRGFLITRDERYLEPYHTGLRLYEPAMGRLRALASGEGEVSEMSRWGDLKTRELAAVLADYHAKGLDAAQAHVLQGLGKQYMDRFREVQSGLVRRLEARHEQNSLSLAQLATDTRLRVSAAALVLFLFTLTGTLLLAAEIRRERAVTADLGVSERRYRELSETLEEQVAARTESLEQLNSELSAFSYSVSHDLRAPLRSIDGFSQMIMEDYSDRLDAPGLDMLRRVRAAAARMGQLIQSLLDLSRVTRNEIDRQQVSVSALAENILAGLAAAEPERRVEVAIEPGLVATADPHLMNVALQNLLANAWKFSAKNEHARIEVGRNAGGAGTEFYVRDNGAGFDAAHADRLFSPFQRFHRASEFDGTGIGLATVQRIVHRHGGGIRAESKPGEGAAFYFNV